ncbi:MAG: DUF6882 domain-containing protein [Pseudomonadota bacterium]
MAVKAEKRANGRGLAIKPWGGELVDVDRFWADAWANLYAQQSALAKRFKLADAEWAVDQQAGIIQFERKDGSLVTGPVQIVGAWNPRTSLFTWGWDHPSVQTRLRADAERTRWFGDKHGLNELTERRLKLSEMDAWRLTAVAMKVNAATGAYRGPTENGPVIFMTLGDLKIKS